MSEIWKPVLGYEGYYEVSSVGRVRSVTRKHTVATTNTRPYTRTRKSMLLKTPRNGAGYPLVGLSRNGATVSMHVHVLVLEAFSGERDAGVVARHLNGVRDDNRAENLVWGTYKENQHDRRRHGSHLEGSAVATSKLTEMSVRVIRRLMGRLSNKEISTVWGVDKSNVSCIMLRKTWKHV